MGTKNNKSMFAQALFGGTRRAVLSVLFRNPDQTYYLRQMIRLIGAGQGAVQRELKRLAEAGILTRSRVGKQVYFQANPQCPIYSELRTIILKTSGLADVLRTSLNPLSNHIRVAFIYGSFASGRDTAASDIDTIVIGDAPFKDVVQALQKAQSLLSREVNPTVYPVKEFSDKMTKNHHFVTKVIKGDKIFLIGDEHELAGLASKPLAD
ncbi:MAG: nucleotidyltransferase domain-containing protein [Candidatus Latescibacteria bacterium]|nr:nucleotidyltransferase domain-containing protein [Candidatus Latescibacterota bacterium]